jgi:cytochrome b6-f complex iron-sulfur subunit
MERASRTRRRVVKTLILGLGLPPLLWRFLTPGVVSQAVLLEVERSAIPANGALVFRERRIAIVEDEGELYALDLVCTHLGCTVSVTADEWICPCHGSAFDRRGEVLRGPADRPLRRLSVQQENGRVQVTT